MFDLIIESDLAVNCNSPRFKEVTSFVSIVKTKFIVRNETYYLFIASLITYLPFMDIEAQETTERKFDFGES